MVWGTRRINENEMVWRYGRKVCCLIRAKQVVNVKEKVKRGGGGAKKVYQDCVSHQPPSSLGRYGVDLIQLLSCAPLETVAKLHLLKPAL